jgi:hypothetical protein
VADVPGLATRVGAAAYTGLGAGIIAGLLIGAIETLVIAREGLGADHQVLWYGPLAYALLLGLGGFAAGIVLGVLPMERPEIRGWTASLVLIALGVMPALMIALFRIRRDVFHEQMPPMPVLAGVLGVAGACAALFLSGALAGGRLGAFGAIPALRSARSWSAAARSRARLYPRRPRPRHRRW